jgi:hypothetical protein
MIILNRKINNNIWINLNEKKNYIKITKIKKKETNNINNLKYCQVNITLTSYKQNNGSQKINELIKVIINYCICI